MWHVVLKPKGIEVNVGQEFVTKIGERVAIKFLQYFLNKKNVVWNRCVLLYVIAFA